MDSKKECNCTECKCCADCGTGNCECGDKCECCDACAGKREAKRCTKSKAKGGKGCRGREQRECRDACADASGACKCGDECERRCRRPKPRLAGGRACKCQGSCECCKACGSKFALFTKRRSRKHPNELCRHRPSPADAACSCEGECRCCSGRAAADEAEDAARCSVKVVADEGTDVVQAPEAGACRVTVRVASSAACERRAGTRGDGRACRSCASCVSTKHEKAACGGEGGGERRDARGDEAGGCRCKGECKCCVPCQPEGEKHDCCCEKDGKGCKCCGACGDESKGCECKGGCQCCSCCRAGKGKADCKCCVACGDEAKTCKCAGECQCCSGCSKDRLDADRKGHPCCVEVKVGETGAVVKCFREPSKLGGKGCCVVVDLTAGGCKCCVACGDESKLCKCEGECECCSDCPGKKKSDGAAKSGCGC